MPTDIDSELRQIAAALTADPPPGHEWPLDQHVLVQRPDRSRRVLVPTLAAATVVAVGVGVGGLWLATNRDPAGGPTLDTTASASAPPSGPATSPTVPELSGAAPRPALFPAVGEPGPADADRVALYASQTAWENPPSTSTLVGRRTADGFSDGIRIEATAATPDLPGDSQPVTAGGRPARLFTVTGTAIEQTLVIDPATQGEATLVITGTDPVGFVDTGGQASTTAATGADTPVGLTIDALPAGYDVIVAPQPAVPGALTVALRDQPQGGGGDGASVWVTLTNPVLGLTGVDVRTVDINGADGWQLVNETGSPVFWPVAPSTWASVSGFRNPEQSAAFARQVSFIDEAAWQERYGVDDPDFPNRPGSPDPVAASAAELVRVLPSRVPDGMILRSLNISTMRFGDDFVERIYATSGPTPETQPALLLTAVDARYASVDVPADAEPIVVQGVDGHLFASGPDSQTVAFGPIDGVTFSLTGVHVTTDQLLAAGAGAAPAADGYGAVLDPAVLPAGVVDHGAGNRAESTFFTRHADAGMATMNWADNHRSMWARVVPVDPTALIASRFGNASIQDVTIGDQPGYIATGLPDGPSAGVTTLAWSDGDRTLFLYGNGVTTQELLDTAQSIKPVPANQWTASADAILAPPMTAPASTSIVITSTTTTG